jgi:hypothetical protein
MYIVALLQLRAATPYDRLMIPMLAILKKFGQQVLSPRESQA